MSDTVFVRYDKLRNKEYITWKDEEFVNDFGYTLLDFLYVDVKNRYYEIIDGATKENHKEIYEKVSNLFNQDDTLFCKLFFDEQYNKHLQNLSDYSAPYKKYSIANKSYIDVNNVPPFNSERDKEIRAMLGNIEKIQKIFSSIIDFCAINTATKNDNIYNRYVNKFHFACTKIFGDFITPRTTFSLSKPLLPKLTSLDDLEKEYKDYLKSKKEFKMDPDPIDEYYYVCGGTTSFFVTTMFQLFNRHYIISKCKNCGKLFVPSKNNSALYCDRKSPQNPNKTCKEFEGSKPKGSNALYRKIYQKKFAKVSRNKDDYTLKKEFEIWKEKSKKMKDKYNSGKITDDEYVDWLIKNDK